METSWESELAKLLRDLLAVQGELLAILVRKRELLMASDGAALAALAPQEEKLLAGLQECVQRREQLLARAGQAGLPAANIRALAGSLPQAKRGDFDESIKLASSRARLLRHHSLTNWVVVQRTVLHLSQMLEIIATGGRLTPTYGGREAVQPSGALVDGAA